MELETVRNTAVQIEPIRKEYKAKVPDDQNQQLKHTGKVQQPNVPVFNTGGNVTTVADGKEEKEKQLKSVLDQVNNKLKMTRTRCEYSRNNEINRTSIKVIDEVTGDVIREIPPEDTIKMIEKLWKLAGILMDEKL